ncbi:hypothetical protein EB796_018393 [Bugula neritina]|uniref:Uncharacterized protein n=1 Tax=Bugula neritina TaxID=10212 RepID=A0A7J7JBI8_BUGNE|nr:hypothetical protein EB796_018393 [Bugula neritina]
MPRASADLGENLYLVKMPNFLSVEPRPFDPEQYETEIDDDEVMDEEGRARLKLKVENTIRPHSTDSFTHKKLSMSSAERSAKSAKTKVLPAAGADPELSKSESIKKEEERLKASIRRENQQRRTRERAYSRSSLDTSFLEDEMDVSLAAIKNKFKSADDEMAAEQPEVMLKVIVK